MLINLSKLLIDKAMKIHRATEILANTINKLFTCCKEESLESH